MTVPGPPWAATHQVGAGGAVSYPGPGVHHGPPHTLSAGQPVRVIARAGGWVQIDTPTGWWAWLDERLLWPVPQPHFAPPPPYQAVPGMAPEVRRGRAGPIVAAVVIVVALVGIGGLVAANLLGDDDPGAETAGELPPLETLVDLEPPPGWVMADDGLTAAESPEALRGDDPTAPRVRFVPTLVSDDRLADPEAIDAAIAEAVERATKLEAGPDEITVGGRPALAVTVREQTASGGSVVRRFVIVTTSDDRSALFVAESPADEFDGAADLMLDAIGTN